VAATICQSENFWNSKAQRDFNLPLEIIHAVTPAEQYRILFEIYTPELLTGMPPGTYTPIFFWKEALLYNQPHLLTSGNWRDHALFYNLPSTQIITQLNQGDNARIQAIVEAIHNSGLSSEEIAGIYTRIINVLYTQAMSEKYFQAAEKLAKTGVVDFEMSSYEMITEYDTDIETIETLIKQAQPDFLVNYDIGELLGRVQDEGVQNPEVLKYLLGTVYSKESIHDLIRDLLIDDDSLLAFLVRNYLLSGNPS
jgi:hypothetical protein